MEDFEETIEIPKPVGLINRFVIEKKDTVVKRHGIIDERLDDQHYLITWFNIFGQNSWQTILDISEMQQLYIFETREGYLYAFEEWSKQMNRMSEEDWKKWNQENRHE